MRLYVGGYDFGSKSYSGTSPNIKLNPIQSVPVNRNVRQYRLVHHYGRLFTIADVSVNFTAFFDTHHTISTEKQSKQYVSVIFSSIFDTHDKNMAETSGEWNVSVNYYEIFGTHICCYVQRQARGVQKGM